MRFELLILDCDGVLVDSEPIVNQVFVEMMAEQGFRLDPGQTLRRFGGFSMSNRLAEIERQLEWSVPEDFEAAFDRRLAEAMPERLRPVNGVVDALAEIEGPRCVASNGSLGDIRSRLGLVGLLADFEDHLFSAAQVARAKPHPDLFLHAARQMRVDPAACVVVEDSPLGVEAGVRAGMRVFGFAESTDPEALRAAGATVFDEMTRLPDLLRSAG